MGLWHVNGWRNKDGGLEESAPVQGWLSLGGTESCLYFDTDGLVVGMLAPEAVSSLELPTPFFNFVKQIGSIMDDTFQREQ